MMGEIEKGREEVKKKETKQYKQENLFQKKR